MTHLSDPTYKKVVSLLPVLCIDLIIRNPERQVLLVQRAEAPRASQWWLPGGRVYHGEDIISAAHRKAHDEVGLSIYDPRPLGFYEEQYDAVDNWTGQRLHTVSIVFEGRCGPQPVRLDDSSSDFRWADALPQDFDRRFWRWRER